MYLNALANNGGRIIIENICTQSSKYNSLKPQPQPQPSYGLKQATRRNTPKNQIKEPKHHNLKFLLFPQLGTNLLAIKEINVKSKKENAAVKSTKYIGISGSFIIAEMNPEVLKNMPVKNHKIDGIKE